MKNALILLAGGTGSRLKNIKKTIPKQFIKVPNSNKGANLKEGATVKLSWKASDSRALDLG